MSSNSQARLSSSPVNQPAAEAAGTGRSVIAGQFKPKDSARTNGSAAGNILTSERVFQILDDAGVSLFCDQYGNAFAALPWHRPETHWECVPVKTRKFRQRLNELIDNADHTKASAAFLKQMVPEVELRCEEAAPIELHNRVTIAENGIHVDIGDDLRRTILVTSERYRVVQDPKPRFYRSKHQRPLLG